jgi:hypothetical protein
MDISIGVTYAHALERRLHITKWKKIGSFFLPFFLIILNFICYQKFIYLLFQV